MKLVSVLKVLCFLLSVSDAVKIFKFTDNREEDTGAKIKAKPGQDKLVTDVALCFDVFVTLIRSFQFLNSEGLTDLAVYVPEALDSIQVKFKGIWYIAYNDLVEPYNWGTFCLSYDTRDESITLAYKGIIIFTKKDPAILGTRSLSPTLLSSLLLGDKDGPDTMAGLITNFRMWSKPFTQNQLIVISKCDGPLAEPVGGNPDLINWETEEWILDEGITEQSAERYPCEKEDKDVFDVLMPTPAENYQSAVETCVALGGTMPLPKSYDEVDTLQKIAATFIDKSTCFSYVWIPIVQSELDMNLWYTEEEYEEETQPPWLEWEPGQPNGQDRQTCTGISVTGNNLLYDLTCSDSTLCYMCRFEDITFFKFRGLCENLEEMMDQRYLIDTEILVTTLEKGIVFTGFKRSRIMLDTGMNRWKVTSMFDETPIITLAFEVWIYNNQSGDCYSDILEGSSNRSHNLGHT